MVSRTCWLVSLVAGVLLAGNAMAELRLRPGMTGVADLGAIRCETFNAMHPFGPTGMEQAALTWAEGYIYARSGKTLEKVLEALPGGGAEWTFDTLTGHIVAYCKASPDAPVPAAVDDLWMALQ